jgi:hypothetical protein
MAEIKVAIDLMKAKFWDELVEKFFQDYDEDEFALLFTSQYDTVKNLYRFGDKGGIKSVPAD